MRHIIAVLLFFISITTFSQDSDHLVRDTTNLPARLDSINARINKYDDSVERAMIDRQTKQSVDYFVQLQKERKAKEKKQAIIRIAIGIGFLIILIVGLRRRRTPKK